MNLKSTLICTALLGLCSLSAQAATWSKAASGSNCNSVNAASCTIAKPAADGSGATVTAWSNTGGSGAWAAATLTSHSGGFGVNNGNGADGGEGTNPEHAIDNDYFVDAVRFQFGQSTSLASVSMGWSTTDSDFSVLAWTGGNVGAGGPAMGTLNSMAGWTVVGNYAAVRAPDGSSTTTINSTNVTSSFWLITAYNSAFGTGTNLSNGNDFFKLLSVSGSTNTPSTRVSEPGALALAGLGLFGAAVVRRRRKQA